MPNFQVKVILTDIEGTTTSISFVKDVLFPYAKLHTKSYLEQNWQDANTQTLVQELTRLPQFKQFAAEMGINAAGGEHTELVTVKNIASFVNYLIDKDLKLGPLKTLQGLVWAKGYADGTIKGHIYADVLDAFKRWHDANLRIAIYSSGSVKAQQLLFGQTEYGNLLPYIQGHYDTTVGHKQQIESYENIARDLGVDVEEVLFLTDVVKEAEAARAAGMQVVLLNRPGNAPLTDDDKTAFVVVNDFDSLTLKAV